MRKAAPVAAPGFFELVRALGDGEETRSVVDALIRRARRVPLGARVQHGLGGRVVCSRPYENYPALRLIYRVDDEGRVWLYHIGPYDPVSAAEERS